MKIKLILVGRTEEKFLEDGISMYQKRLANYISFETIVIPALKNTKNLSIEQQKTKEAELILKQINSSDFVVLFDEFGKQYRSIELAEFMQQRMVSGLKQLVFVVGGPYGFAPEIHKIATQKISLSKLTFSHQMVRLIIIEQFYRAFSILSNEPYHHE